MDVFYIAIQSQNRITITLFYSVCNENRGCFDVDGNNVACQIVSSRNIKCDMNNVPCQEVSSINSKCVEINVPCPEVSNMTSDYDGKKILPGSVKHELQMVSIFPYFPLHKLGSIAAFYFSAL